MYRGKPEMVRTRLYRRGGILEFRVLCSSHIVQVERNAMGRVESEACGVDLWSRNLRALDPAAQDHGVAEI
jgi:hypothetical protein